MTIPIAPLRLLAFALLFGMLGSGCGQRRSETGAANAAPASETRKVIRIGYQKAGAVDVLRLKGDLEKRLAPQGVAVEWTNYTAGPQILEAIGVNSADIGSMGDAPPIFAQAAGIPLVYVANQPPGDPAGRAILVPQNSPIHSLKDLRGKRIAVQKGTGTHNFLVQVLDKAGVPYDSIQVSYLTPPDGRAAFESGRIDAWAIWDPFLAAAQQDLKARVLIDGRNIVSAGGFFLSSRTFATAHPDWIRALLEEVDRTSIWVNQHPHEAAELLAPSMGVDVATLEAIQKRNQIGERYVGFHPIDAQVVATQQQVADNFYRIGILPKRVKVRDGLLTPEQYAALLPKTEPTPAAIASRDSKTVGR